MSRFASETDLADPITRHTLRHQPLAAPAGLSEIFARAGVADDLAAAERELLARTASRSALLAEAGAYTVAAGGKRLRAALVLLAARLGRYDFARAVRPAVAVELMHAASLVHDDLVDHAGLRRGRTTIHERWDKDVALMLGDYFFALSTFELAAEPNPQVVRFYAEAAETVVNGELNPVTQVTPLDVALRQYRFKTSSKTAVLFAAACKAGIAVADGSPADIAALAVYGLELGMAFQIVDDVLDFVGDERVLGKPAGNDLREGTLTLPLIYAVHQGNHPQLRRVAVVQRPDPDAVPELVAAVIEAGGVDAALADARSAIDRGNAALERFPASAAREALGQIGEFVLNRTT